MRPACTATLLLDDDRVRVTRFDFGPGAETGWHRHGQPLGLCQPERLGDADGQLHGERERLAHPLTLRDGVALA